MHTMSDSDFWYTIDPADLWVTDKLILAKKLGHHCGPAGVRVPRDDYYIVRPCVNYRMMSRGAAVVYLEGGTDTIPDGYFWCEVFCGRHMSFDYYYGEQTLAVEGFKQLGRIDRFLKWQKIDYQFALPDFLQEIANRNKWLNVEVIGNKIIEVHFRYNDDFANHTSNEIIPIWKDQFYPSEAGDRIGFLLK